MAYEYETGLKRRSGQQLFSKNLFKIFLLIGLLAVLFSSGENSFGQDFSSAPQNADSGKKADQNMRSIARINPSTLAMEFSVPFMSYPGRNGNGMSLGLNYSSKVWRMDEWYSWWIPQPYSCNKLYRTALLAKYGERSVSGWTSTLTPPTIEEKFQVYDINGTPRGTHVDSLTLSSMFGDLERNYLDILQNLISNPNMPCGWYCAQYEAGTPENPYPTHCIQYDYNMCTTGGGGIEPGQGCQPPYPPLPPPPPVDPLFTVKRVYVRTSDGASHEFREGDSAVQCGTTQSGCSNTPNGTYLSVDGSGMKLKRDNDGSTLFMPDGGRYIFPATAQHGAADATSLFFASEFIDTNGNRTQFGETVSGNKVYPVQTDTMGRTLTDPLPQNFGVFPQPSQEQDVNLPGLNSTQNYHLAWNRLKPVECEALEESCGDGALENQNEKLYYFTDKKCNGNSVENIGGTGEFLFTEHGFGLVSCNGLGTGQGSNETGIGIGNENSNVGPVPRRFNPTVLSSIALPNGKSYEFKYNQWGEITKITYPTGSYEVFVYDRIDPVSSYNSGAYSQTNRGVIRREIYRKTTDNQYVLEQSWQYQSEAGKITTTASKGDDASAEGIKTERFVHIDTSGGEFGFNDPLAGMTKEERTYDESENHVLRSRTITEWTLKGSGGEARDPRVKRTVSVMIEGGQALANLSETEYNEPATSGNNAQTDAEYFSHLNVKRTKGYHYAAIPVSTAQAGTLSQIAAYFNQNLLASVSETDYQYNPDYKARGISSLPVESRVLNPANTSEIIAKTQTIYDNTLPASSSNYPYSIEDYGISEPFSCPAGSQSVTCWQSPNSSYLGHATTSRLWDKDNNDWIETHTQYDIFGNAIKVKDPVENEAETIYENTTTKPYLYAYPTKVITPAPDPNKTHGTQQKSTAETTYDFTTGLVLKVKDDFGQEIQTEYNDAMLRPTRVSGVGDFVIPVTETIYDDDALTVKTRKQIDETNWDEATTFTDSLGRTIKTRAADSQGDVFVKTEYDKLGRVKRTSNPYRQNNDVLWSEVRYDEMGRAVESYAPAQSGLGNSLGVTSYGISTVPSATGTFVVTTDAAGKKSRAITNALGQLIRVDEPDSAGSIDALPQASPSPNPSPSPTPPIGGGNCYNRPQNEPPGQCRGNGNGSYDSLSTTYKYNAQGKMVEVTQGGQHRYFLYDSLGRLIKVRQPEQEVNVALNQTDSITGNSQWTAAFTYDVMSNVLTTIDAKGTVITNTYDKANRITTKSYSDGTPAVEYFYDGKGLPEEQSPNYAKGKLTVVTSSVSETRYTLFDYLGRLAESEQRTPFGDEAVGAATAQVSKYAYNLSGALIEQTYPSGRTVVNEFEPDGDLARISGLANSTAMPRTYANNFLYTADGRIQRLKLGNGRWESAKFNDRLQVTELALGTSNGDGSLWKLNYQYGELQSNGTTVDEAKNTGNIAKQTISFSGLANPFVQTYKYDSLYRVTEAKETTNSGNVQMWKQTYNYDRFGNRTNFSQIIGTTQLTLDNQTLPDIDPQTNRFLTGDGYSYDKNGNLLNDPANGGRSFTFNGENKQIEVKDANNQTIGEYLYDGQGKRVKKKTNTETTVFIYDGMGKLVAEYSTQTPPQNPTTNYTATDLLDSPRVITDASGNVVSRRDFMPFGEELYADGANRTTNNKYSTTNLDSVRQRFTGYQKDTETNLDFAEARYYNNQHARFTAVDPLLASGKSANPQTFNRYVYVMNNPIKHTDPKGLQAGGFADIFGGWVVAYETIKRTFSSGGSSVTVQDQIPAAIKYYNNTQSGNLDLPDRKNSPVTRNLDQLVNSTTKPSIEALGQAMEKVDNGIQYVPVFSSIYNAQKAATQADLGTGSRTNAILQTGLLFADLATLPTGGGLKRQVGKEIVETSSRGLLIGGERNAGGFIRSFITTADQTFYRVSSSAQRAEGGFLMARPPVNRASAIEAFALPNINDASLIQEVFVPAGTRLQRSRAASLFGRSGGAEQFELMQKLPERNFGPRISFSQGCRFSCGN